MSDPYLALPPFNPAPPDGDADLAAPPADAADADDPDDAVEESSPEEPSPDPVEAQEPVADDADADETDEPAEDDRDWLLERARKADEYEQYLSRLEAERVEREATSHWEARLEEANTEFARREDVIYQQAEKSLNPAAYLREHLNQLNIDANSWYAAYRDAREQALWTYQHQREVPLHAQRVAEHYQLPGGAVEELLRYPVELMEREAQRLRRDLIKERQRQKEITQLKAKAAKRQFVEKQMAAPGDGRGTVGSDITPGSAEHYFAMPWTRGR